MSASATAKHKVETLQEQLRMYQDTLRRQEQGLRELQAHISQTRTVVNITMPGEIDRAHREYINTLDRSERASELRWRRSDAVCGAARTVIAEVCGCVFVWARILVVLVGVFAAGLVSSTPVLWWSGH